MQIYINEALVDVCETETVQAILQRLHYLNSGIALAVNQTIVSRGEWDTTSLKEFDHITIFQIITGG